MCTGRRNKSTTPSKNPPQSSSQQPLKVIYDNATNLKYNELPKDDEVKDISQFHKLYKILLLGDSGVGKSAIVTRWVDNDFDFSHFATIGVDFKTKDLMVDDKVYRIQIWDTAGQERYQSITSTYFRGSHGVILVYDITDENSFKNIGNWLEALKKNADSNSIKKIIVGNKYDLSEKAVISEKQAKEFSEERQIPHVYVSAKDGTNVSQIFKILMASIVK